MNKWIVMTLCFLVAVCSHAAFPTHSNSTNFTIATAGIADYNAFNWDWAAQEDQSFSIVFDQAVTNGQVVFRMAARQGSTVDLEVVGWTFATNTTLSGTLVSSNIPPCGLYYTEFYLQNTNSSPVVLYRSLARGIINIWNSLSRIVPVKKRVEL